MTTSRPKIRRSSTIPNLSELNIRHVEDVDVEWVPLPLDTPDEVVLSKLVENMQAKTTKLLSLQEEINSLNNRIQQHDKTYKSITETLQKAQESQKHALVTRFEYTNLVAKKKQVLKEQLVKLIGSFNVLTRQNKGHNFTDEQKTTLQTLEQQAQAMLSKMHAS